MKNVRATRSIYLAISFKSAVRIFRLSVTLSILLLFINTAAKAQESNSVKHPFVSHHSLAILLGHTQTSQGSEDGKQKWLAMPSWALEYNYHLNRRWNIGLHNDIVMETFKVEDHSTHQEFIERTRPITSLAVGGYKIRDLFILELGLGAEFAKEGNFFVIRICLSSAKRIGSEGQFNV